MTYEVTRPPTTPDGVHSRIRYTGQVKNCERSDLDPVVWDQQVELGYTPEVVLCVDSSSFKDPSGAKYEGDLFVRNTRGNINNSNLVFRIKYCDETADPGCRDYVDKVGRISMGMYYMNYFVDQSDFSDPVKPGLQVSMYQLSQIISQSIEIVSQINEIVTDSSLFLSDTSTEEFYSFSSSSISVSEFEPTN